MTISYELTEAEKQEMLMAQEFQKRAAKALGAFVPGLGEPRLMAPGTSLHYMGTHRIGEKNDGTSVCDDSSRVWNFGNLFLGGNGMIPTANTVNPTLTSMAIAVRGAQALLRELAS